MILRRCQITKADVLGLKFQIFFRMTLKIRRNSCLFSRMEHHLQDQRKQITYKALKKRPSSFPLLQDCTIVRRNLNFLPIYINQIKIQLCSKMCFHWFTDCFKKVQNSVIPSYESTRVQEKKFRQII